MNLILTVLEIVTPAFLTTLIGFPWSQQGLKYRIEAATKLATMLSVNVLNGSHLSQAAWRALPCGRSGKPRIS